MRAFSLAFLLTVATAAAREPLTHVWAIEGIERSALVFPSSLGRERAAPLVFGFHGHGGSAQNAARSFRLHELWPEAVVIYMQGIPTPGKLTDPEGKRYGWQSGAGDQGDRDLKFFDAVLKSAREKQKIDDSRIYATGHSNGGGFTYLLWAERPAVFAAVAPSASAAARSVAKLTPKPALHLAGTNDPLVKYAWQERMLTAVKQINDSAAGGLSWAADCTLYPPKSDQGAPLVIYLHQGGHKYPEAGPALIVRFFKEQVKKSG